MLKQFFLFGMVIIAFLCNNPPTNATNNDPSEVKLALVGIAIDEITQTPISAANIELKDVQSKEKVEVITKNDGSFYFKLKADKQYELSLFDSFGALISKKVISTVGKYDPEILHTILTKKEDCYEDMKGLNNSATINDETGENVR